MVSIKGCPMDEPATAKLFTHGRSQAVRLPKAFRLPGTQVRVTRNGRGVLLEPIASTPQEIRANFAEIDALSDEPFMPEGRDQPMMPPIDDADPFEE